MGRPGKAVEHDRRAGRAGAAVQMARRLVQIARDVEQARGEARAVEVTLGDGRWTGAGDDAVPGVGEAKRRYLGLEAEAPHLQTQHVKALGQGDGVGSTHQEDGVDEVHAASSGVDGSSPAYARLQDALTLDVAELAPLGCETLGSPNLAEPYRQEAHRLRAGQGPHSHRDRVDARQSEHRGSPAGLDLGRPAPTKRQERERLRAFHDVGAHVVLGAVAREQRCRLAELVLGDCAQPDPVLFRRSAHELRDSGDRCLTDARKDDQASPWRTSELGRQVAIQARVGVQISMRSAGNGREPVKVFGRTPLDRHGQDLERSGDRVVQLACRRDRRVPLVRPQEIEVDRRNLERSKEVLPLCLLLGGSSLDKHGQ